MEIVCDSAFQNRHFDPESGQLRIERSPISKATVNPYYGKEIPKSEELGLTPDRVYYMLRDPGELAKAAPTFRTKELLFKHIGVSADNPQQEHIAGTTGSNITFEAPYLMADLSVWDADAIAGIQTGTLRELSCSYSFRADMTPGVYEGQHYDGVMRDIQGNHVALVKAGRAGSDVRAADKAIEIFALDEFEESKHPRSPNGEFGSGGPGSSGSGGNQDHPFIKTFLSEHKTLADQKGYLEKVPHEKLLTAHKLSSKSDSPESKKVKNLIEKELDSRAERGTGKGFGEDSQLETKMTETKFGKALYAILCAASPKLAQDAALKPLVMGLTRKQCDLRSLEPKLLAMDSALRMEAARKAMDAVKDASEEEESEKEKREEPAKDKRAKDRKRAKDLSFEEWAKEEESEPSHEKARDAEEDDEDREKRREYEKKAEDARHAADGGFDDLVEKLKGKGYSHEYATKVAGKVAAEKSGDCAFGAKDKRKAKDRITHDAQTSEERAMWAQMRKDGSADDPEDDAMPASLRKAGDSRIKKAMDEFRSELREAEEARRAVAPIVGNVLAQDSAEEIYGFALDQMKVDRKGVEGTRALRAMFNLAHQASKPAPRLAYDHSVKIEDKFPKAARQIKLM